jgi:uncharacterized protein (TIGR00159 family)
MLLGLSIGFLEINWVDVIDILLVAVLLFNLYKLIRGSVAVKIFIGIIALYLTYLVVNATDMELLTSILGQFMNVGVLAAIILFQQEIRKFLLLIGRSTNFNRIFLNVFRIGKNTELDEFNINPVLDAMKTLSGTNTGALIVVSRHNDLNYYAETGDLLDATISKRLLLSIFYKNSPLHDGAVIIHKNRIVAARCILPVSESPNIPANLGLRHRAGVGLAELTNAIVLIVSEETGQLSFVKNGDIAHGTTILELRKVLNRYLSDEDTAAEEAKTPAVKANTALPEKPQTVEG